MKAIKFKDQNIVFGENQKEYKVLPALKINSKEGFVITCWKMSFIERLYTLITGKIWMNTITFNAPLQPKNLCVYRKQAYTKPSDKFTLKQRFQNSKKQRKINKAVDKQKNYAKHLKKVD